MSYPWCNRYNLKTLKVTGEGDLLTFETPSEKAEVHLKNNSIEKVSVTVNGEKKMIPFSEAHHIVVGEGNFKRDVYHFLTPKGLAPHLRLGLTQHQGLGTWSSLPHPFELKPELGFEELFFYLLQGGTQKALQVGKGVCCDGAEVNAAWFVQNRSWGVIPMGYHPVVGEPQVHVSYVWAYLAKKKEWEKI